MKVNWWNVAPYIYKNEQGQIKGIFKEIVEIIVKKCCGECTDFIYDSGLNPSNNSEILKSRMGKAVVLGTMCVGHILSARSKYAEKQVGYRSSLK